MSTKPIYVAGPMTGLPQFNIPAFNRQTERLRAAGYAVVSPVELDSDEIRAEALASPDGHMLPNGKIGGESWGEILGRDVRVIADTIGAICVLPGWQKSRGARLEVFVGLLCGLKVYRDIESDGPPELKELHRHDVVYALARSFL